jgi:2-polyprenyl-3-methyl-5-hydroxy-6-metoxy-1,4-benzoquinol methylase
MPDDAERDAFAGRLFGSMLGYFDVLSIDLGLRLGLYRALGELGATTSAELAARAGIAERYAREWLEQQATRQILRADVTAAPPRFWLPAGHAEVLLDRDSLAYMGASVAQQLTLARVLDQLVDAYRTGSGVPYEAYGEASVQAQGAGNRPTFLATLPNEWLPAIADIDARLRSGPSRILDVGCGTGWSSIAMAKRYPQARVDGVDPDITSIEHARKNAAEAGVADRVRFHAKSGAELDGSGDNRYDFATAFECVHDMARPVEVLGAVRRTLAERGAMLVVDERTRERFTGEPDDLEAYLYGWSILDCLPGGMYDQPSEATGTVMRPATLERYAEHAGFSGFEVLPVDHEMFRLYVLRP